MNMSPTKILCRQSEIFTISNLFGRLISSLAILNLHSRLRFFFYHIEPYQTKFLLCFIVLMIVTLSDFVVLQVHVSYLHIGLLFHMYYLVRYH